jgi:hypothetical protein
MAKKFNKQQREILARKLGYDGPMNMFDQFVKSDPAMERKYNTVVEKFMARGGVVKKYQEGGAVPVQNQMNDRVASRMAANTDPNISEYRKDSDAFRNQLWEKYYAPGVNKLLQDYGAKENVLKNQIETTIQKGKQDTDAYLKNLVSNETNALLNSPAYKNELDALRAALPKMQAAPLSDQGFEIPNQRGLGGGLYPFSNETDKQIAINSVANKIKRREDQAKLQVVQDLMAKYNVDSFNRAKNTFFDFSKPGHLEDAIAAITETATPIELENRVAPTLNTLYAQQEQLLGEKDRSLITYNEQATKDFDNLNATVLRYSQVLDNDKFKKLDDLKNDYIKKYGDAFYGDKQILDQYNKDYQNIEAQFNQQLNTLYSPDFDIRTQSFADLRKQVEQDTAAKQEAQRRQTEQLLASGQIPDVSGRQLSPIPFPDMTQMKPLMPNVVGLTGEQAYNLINQTLQNYARNTGQTIDAVRANPEIQQQVTKAMEANLSARGADLPGAGAGATTGLAGVMGVGTTATQTPTAGTTAGTGGSGTTATTTPQIPSTGATGGTGTTATTTPQLPTTGATGTPTSTGAGVTTTGATGTQMANIPTTDTVTRVNIPQVTAATVPTEPGQMVSPTGAPAEAAKIPGAVVSGTAQVTPTAPQAAATMEAATATGAVSGELAGLQPAQGAVSEQAQVQAATMEPTSTALAGMQAAQTTAGQVQGAPTRELVAGELIEGPTVDRAAVESLLAKNEAAQGVVTEDMTVQGQLAKLTSNFEANNPPAWAAGALRNATATLAQRGLAASSLAGQAVIQATIESALPIASADAQIYREMGIQNLTNRQQMAVLSAQQRAAFLGQEFDQAFQTRVTNAATISEIANLNFSAKQQIALENARLTESVNLANLNNRQALVMANAAQIATLETANLNNRQQANVLNAQAFLQMDLTNLSNQQQTALFKSQSMIQSILSDQAAENAARQFNASSINQVNQFYDGLTAQIKQFNATQTNAMNQFNVSQINSVAEFNASQQNARDQFNAEYRRIIDQSNAEWRRNIALADTAAINRANEVNATAALGISTIEYNNLWQTYRDNIEYAWKTGENALDRENELARQVLAKQATIEAAKFQIEAAKYQALGGLAAQIFDKGGIAAAAGSTIIGAVTGLAAGVRNAISGGSSSGVNFNKVTGPNAGWTYYSDGKDTIGIDPQGSVYYNNTLVADDQLAYTEYGYSQNDLYGYGEAPDYVGSDLYGYSGSDTRDEIDSYIFPTD